MKSIHETRIVAKTRIRFKYKRCGKDLGMIRVFLRACTLRKQVMKMNKKFKKMMFGSVLAARDARAIPVVSTHSHIETGNGGCECNRRIESKCSGEVV